MPYILREISTHKAVLNGNVIDIYEKGFNIEGIKYNDVLIDTIPASNEDDLFAIFDNFEENNRSNREEFFARREF